MNNKERIERAREIINSALDMFAKAYEEECTCHGYSERSCAYCNGMISADRVLEQAKNVLNMDDEV